jgi:putative colanic acid biosynthesis UDP-glucose lipid carrier transferase
VATNYSKFTRTIYLAGDILLLNLSFSIAYYYKFESLGISEDLHYVIMGLFINLSWIAGAFFMRIYDIERVEPNRHVIKNTLQMVAIHALSVAAFIVFRKAYYYSRELLIVTYLLITFLVISWRILSIYAFRLYRKKGYNYRRIIIIGCGEIGQNLLKFFKANPQHGYKFMGFFDDRSVQHPELKGKVADVKSYMLENDIDEVYCSMSDISNSQINELIQVADNNLIRVKIIPDFRDISIRKISFDFYDEYPVLSFREIPLDDALNRVFKRTFDIVFSLAVISLIFSWLFPIIALLIRINSKGPVFFRQKRSGLDNNEFWCWKFRTMYVNDDSNSKQATRNDSRITPIGRILRKTSLDELPQFFNVLIGNMSVVGPRPHMLKHTEEYSKIIDNYMVRHYVKPGVTGLAQAKGYRGETTTPQAMKNRVRVDMFYVENWSFSLDIKIVFMTITGMLKGDSNAF